MRRKSFPLKTHEKISWPFGGFWPLKCVILGSSIHFWTLKSSSWSTLGSLEGCRRVPKPPKMRRKSFPSEFHEKMSRPSGCFWPLKCGILGSPIHFWILESSSGSASGPLEGYRIVSRASDRTSFARYWSQALLSESSVCSPTRNRSHQHSEGMQQNLLVLHSHTSSEQFQIWSNTFQEKIPDKWSLVSKPT